MRYFDIVTTSEVDDSLAKRLGYSKVFVVGKDLEIITDLKIRTGKKAIVRGKNIGTLMRAIKESSVLGIMIDDSLILGKAIMAAKENDKPLILSTEGLNSRNYTTRLKTLYRLRKILKFALKARAEIIFVTLAGDRQSILSTAQMIEIGKFIGANDEQSRKMLSDLGNYHVA